MSFSSALMPGELIIDDSTKLDVVNPGNQVGRGLDLGLRGPADYEYGEFASPFPSNLMIPTSEFQARIQEMEETKSRLSDIILQSELPFKDQDGRNYCWNAAVVHGVEVMRAKQNQPLVQLSYASVGARIKGGRNVGGWGKEALEFIVQNGINTESDWPRHSLDVRQFDTEENRQKALAYRVPEWSELMPRNMQQLISMLLHRIPVAVGYNWWGHEVLAVDAVWQDGMACLRIRNQWNVSPWAENNGFGILKGNRALADDAVAPRSALAA